MTTWHPQDDLLESYAMDKLGGDEAATLEEHLLACSVCRSRLVEVEDFIHTFRRASQESQPTASMAPPVSSPRRLIWGLIATAAVLVLGALAYHWQPRGAPEPAVLLLRPLRGPEMGGTAEKGRPLVLVMDVPAEIQGEYTAEIVDSEGRLILSAKPELRDGRLAIRSPELQPGDHWVRLYRSPRRVDQIAEYRVRVR